MPLRQEIAEAIARNWVDEPAHRPDFLLAEFLTSCLVAFDEAVEARSAPDDPISPVVPLPPLGSLIERQLAAIGLLPSADDPALYRALERGGFGLFLHLQSALDLQTLRGLANCPDRGALLRDAKL
jgi:hypothetical protein